MTEAEQERRLALVEQPVCEGSATQREQRESHVRQNVEKPHLLVVDVVLSLVERGQDGQ